MQLQSSEPTPREHPREQKTSPHTPFLDTEVAVPSNAERERDAQRFQDIMSSVLRRGACSDNIRADLTAALCCETDRKIILARLGEVGLPYSLEVKHRQPFIDAFFPCAEREGDLGWNAIDSIVESAISLKDYQLYERLGREFCKRTVPALSVFNSAVAFNNLLCHNVTQYPEAAVWVQFFKAQGTSQSFQTIYSELWRRIHCGELSSYDHLVSALCATENTHALDILHISLNKILCDTNQPDASHRITPGALLGIGCRAVPLSAMFVIFTAGPQHVFSLTTLTLSAILATTELLLTRKAPQRSSKPPLHGSQLSAFEAFAERVHEKLSAIENLSPQADRIKQLLDQNFENLRLTSETSAQST